MRKRKEVLKKMEQEEIEAFEQVMKKKSEERRKRRDEKREALLQEIREMDAEDASVVEEKKTEESKEGVLEQFKKLQVQEDKRKRRMTVEVGLAKNARRERSSMSLRGGDLGGLVLLSFFLQFLRAHSAEAADSGRGALKEFCEQRNGRILQRAEKQSDFRRCLSRNSFAVDGRSVFGQRTSELERFGEAFSEGGPSDRGLREKDSHGRGQDSGEGRKSARDFRSRFFVWRHSRTVLRFGGAAEKSGNGRRSQPTFLRRLRGPRSLWLRSCSFAVGGESSISEESVFAQREPRIENDDAGEGWCFLFVVCSERCCCFRVFLSAPFFTLFSSVS